MKIIEKNRQASYDYEFVELFTAGIKLVGSEVRPIKTNMTSIKESYCYFKGGQLFIKNMYVKEHEQASHNNHDPYRDRVLLLNKKELAKLERGLQTKGFSIVPTKIFINPKGLIKIEIALAKGKKKHDKRNAIKERDIERDMKRQIS